MINVHYLELFYYVAKHGGFGPAVRNIPYGIQQPALSSQIRELEQRLGTPLFHRRPFGLTVAGRELYPAAQTFFDEVARITKNLRANAADLVRMAASPVVFQHYLRSDRIAGRGWIWRGGVGGDPAAAASAGPARAGLAGLASAGD